MNDLSAVIQKHMQNSDESGSTPPMKITRNVGLQVRVKQKDSELCNESCQVYSMMWTKLVYSKLSCYSSSRLTCACALEHLTLRFLIYLTPNPYKVVQGFPIVFLKFFFLVFCWFSSLIYTGFCSQNKISAHLLLIRSNLVV